MTEPYYDDGQVRIYLGDAAELPLDDGQAAAVVTSPPYNVGMPYADSDDDRPWDAYFADAALWAAEMARVSVEGGRIWVNVVPVAASAPAPAKIHSGRCAKARTNLLRGWMEALEDAGLDIVDICSWPSQRGSGTAWGSWATPSAPNLRGDWEAILWYKKGDYPRRPPAHIPVGWKDPYGGWASLTTNVWKITPQRRDGHPAPFPEDLPERAIRLSSWPGELIVDPFCGTGTTLAVAKALGRKAVGVEKSERYAEMAATRLSCEPLPLFPLEPAPAAASPEPVLRSLFDAAS